MKRTLPPWGFRPVVLALALGVSMGCDRNVAPPPKDDAFDASEWKAVRPASASVPAAASSDEEQMLQEGEALARGACATCHLFPEPDVMDRTTWALKALPAMGEMLGFPIDPEAGPRFPARVLEAKKFPTEPVIAIEQWRAICSWYLAKAPVTAPPQAERPEIKVGLPLFEIVKPDHTLNGRAIMVRIDEPSSRIFVGEYDVNQLTIMDGSGRVKALTKLDSPPVFIDPADGKLTVTLIGSYIPSEELEGSVLRFDDLGKGEGGPETLLTALPRPTHTLRLDVDRDGREDLVVCGYGQYLGALSWHRNLGGGKYEAHIIAEQPGAIRCEPIDLDGDGDMDLVSVFAQALEGIYAHYNDGQGGFTTEPIVQKHSAWGFSGFEFVDFNEDGFMDILATNGDNGDFGAIIPPFKNYHGIRLYPNNGRNGFSEAWFFPLNGAYRALARDFDLDGDLDIAAISFFPDYRRSPRESFVYLKNVSREGAAEPEFEPSSFYESIAARWCVMDVGDVDGDGDMDIVLGANNHGPTYVPRLLHEKWMEVGNTVFILRNTTR